MLAKRTHACGQESSLQPPLACPLRRHPLSSPLPVESLHFADASRVSARALRTMLTPHTDTLRSQNTEQKGTIALFVAACNSRHSRECRQCQLCLHSFLAARHTSPHCRENTIESTLTHPRERVQQAPQARPGQHSPSAPQPAPQISHPLPRQK